MCSVCGEKKIFFFKKKNYFPQSTFMGNENKKIWRAMFPCNYKYILKAAARQYHDLIPVGSEI